MTPSEIIAAVLKEFWAAPKLSNAIMARLAADYACVASYS